MASNNPELETSFPSFKYLGSNHVFSGNRPVCNVCPPLVQKLSPRVWCPGLVQSLEWIRYIDIYHDHKHDVQWSYHVLIRFSVNSGIFKFQRLLGEKALRAPRNTERSYSILLHLWFPALFGNSFPFSPSRLRSWPPSDSLCQVPPQKRMAANDLRLARRGLARRCKHIFKNILEILNRI